MQFKTEFDAAWAYPTKLFVVNVSEWRYMKPEVKKSKCCRCGICSLYCPTGCIEDMGKYFDVNLNHCKGCGLCSRTCPVHAIRMVMEV